MPRYIVIHDTFQKRNRFYVETIKGKNAGEVLQACEVTWSNETNHTVITMGSASKLADNLAKEISTQQILKGNTP